MHAIVQIGSGQFKAEEGATIRVCNQEIKPGGKLTIDKVLLVNTGSAAMIGTPYVAGAKVEAEVLSHGLGEKVRSFRYKRRTKARKTLGHRQPYTDLKVTKIVAPKS